MISAFDLVFPGLTFSLIIATSLILKDGDPFIEKCD